MSAYFHDAAKSQSQEELAVTHASSERGAERRPTMNNGNELEPGITPVNDDNQTGEALAMKKSHHHDAQDEAPANEWREPTSFADAGPDDLPGFDMEVLPLPFIPVVACLSRVFNVSLETITVILTFMVSAAVGKSVRVQNTTGEWVDVGHRVALMSDSDEKVSKVLLSMATAFLEVRFQQASAHVAGESDSDKVRTWFEEASHDDNMTPQSMQELFCCIVAQAKVPSDSPLSGSKNTACPDFAFPPTLDGLCLALESGEPDRDIVIGDADYIINLNGTPSPGAVEERSSFPTDYIYLMSPTEIAYGFLRKSASCLRQDPFALVEPEETVKANDAQIQIGAKGLIHLREVVTHAFRIQARGINEPIKFALSVEALARRESYRKFADSVILKDGQEVEIEQLATKFAAIFELFDDECPGDEISEDSWQSGIRFALCLYFNRQKLAKAVLTSPETSKAERLLQEAVKLGSPFTIGDIVQKQCAGIASDLDAVLAVKALMELGWARPVVTTAEGHTPQYEFHPRAFEHASNASNSNSNSSNDQSCPE